jgi:hypothetical protein
MLQAVGVVLFLFIPLVLSLFVRHPKPIGASLVAGVVLMAGHRFLARPYMRRALGSKCVWCNRVLPPPGEPEAGTTLDLAAADGEVLAARCCSAEHARPPWRFFHFLTLARLPLQLGIFLPLLALLAALGAAAWGHGRSLPAATAFFQLAVGVTVSAAAWGYLLLPAAATPRQAIVVPFPVHNFFLLGVRALLWIFRLVGAWWIVRGALYFIA